MPVTLDDVPLRTTEEPVQAEIVVTLVSPRDYAGVEVVSRPLFLRARDIDYRDFELFGEQRPASPIIAEPATFASATTDIQRAVACSRYAGVFGTPATVSVKDNDPIPSEVTTAVGFSTLNVLRLPPTAPIFLELGYGSESDYSRVANVVSAILRTEGPRIPREDYVVRGNYASGCLACYNQGEVQLGPNNDGTHNSQWKFVVAHEFGHAVQDQASGIPTALYPAYVKTDPGACGGDVPLNAET